MRLQSSETEEQQAVMQWAAYAKGKFPGLQNLYHVPNEGKRSNVAGGIAKSIGLRPGVPDLILDCPSGRYHGARIEMKYGKNTPTKEQLDWLTRMQNAGYFVAICWCSTDAIRILQEYLSLPNGEKMSVDCDSFKEKYGVPAVK